MKGGYFERRSTIDYVATQTQELQVFDAWWLRMIDRSVAVDLIIILLL